MSQGPFVWCAPTRPGRIPDGAIVSGAENGNPMYSCVVDAELHRPGKYARHLNQSASVLSPNGQREVEPDRADQLLLCTWNSAVDNAVPVWVPWPIYASSLPRGVATTPQRSVNSPRALVGRVQFRGGVHPCVVSDSVVLLLWGGAAHRLPADQVSHDLSILCAMPESERDRLPHAVADAELFVSSNGFRACDSRARHILSSMNAVTDDLFCAGLSSFEDLLDWSRPPYAAAGALVPFQPLASRDDVSPRLLVCHDFKGGYIGSDRGGFTRACSPSTSYVLRRWDCVDVFVYFAHRLVAVPPQEWIIAARRNGVPILGTFLVEGEPGPLLSALSLGAKHLERLATLLATMALHYGFHGWLFNIEHPLPPVLVPALLTFVELTHNACREMIPSGVGHVLWYDAVTVQGPLQYQNALTKNNLAFFSRCAGLFTNYWWSDALADASRDIALQVGPGGPRRVWMGTDVFGRGTFGGGGLRSAVGVQSAFSKGLSAAVFAPGWTLECLPASSDVTTTQKFERAFASHDAQMWTPIAAAVASSRHRRRRCVTSMPFASSFCPALSSSSRFHLFGEDACRIAQSSEAPYGAWWCQMSLASPSSVFPNAIQIVPSDSAYFGTCVYRLDGGQPRHQLLLLDSRILAPDEAIIFSISVPTSVAHRLHDLNFESIGAEGSWAPWETSGPEVVEAPLQPQADAARWTTLQWIVMHTTPSVDATVVACLATDADAACIDVGRIAVHRMGDVTSPGPTTAPEGKGGTIVVSRDGAKGWYQPPPPSTAADSSTETAVLLIQHDDEQSSNEDVIVGFAVQPYPYITEFELPTKHSPSTSYRAVLNTAAVLCEPQRRPLIAPVQVRR